MYSWMRLEVIVGIHYADVAIALGETQEVISEAWEEGKSVSAILALSATGCLVASWGHWHIWRIYQEASTNKPVLLQQH